LGNEDLGGFMERLYRVFPWPEDPATWARRVEEGSRLFERLLGHEWLSSLEGKGRVRILDLMGGTGVGGGTLALALGRRGVRAEVVVVDVRRSALTRRRSGVQIPAGPPFWILSMYFKYPSFE
jgi:16S rRNA G1207 methylase RsmC